MSSDFKIISGIVLTAAGAVTGQVWLATMGLSLLLSGLPGTTRPYGAISARPQLLPDARLPVIYGTARVGGNLVYVGSSNGGQYLWMVVALSHGPIQAIDEIFVDGNCAVLADGTVRAKPALFPISAQVIAQGVVEFTCTGHQLITGDDIQLTLRSVTFATVLPPQELGLWTVSVIDADHFTIGATSLYTVAGGFSLYFQRTGPDYATSGAGGTSLIACAKYLGPDNQTMGATGKQSSGGGTLLASDLTTALPEWDATHVGGGVAYLLLKLQAQPGSFPNGIPAIQCNVRGRTVYDPRSATTAFSANPALCLRDYMTNARYGWGLPTSKVYDGDASAGIMAEANYHDEQPYEPVGSGMTAISASTQSTNQITCAGHQVSGAGVHQVFVTGNSSIPDGRYGVTVIDSSHLQFSGYSIPSDGTGGTVQEVHQAAARHTCNGAVDANRSVGENLAQLLTSCRGSIVSWGALHMPFTRRATGQTVAGWTLDDPKKRGGTATLRRAGMAATANGLDVTFPNALKHSQSETFSWPPPEQTNPYPAQDGGLVNRQPLQLPFTTDRYMAERIANPVLGELRNQDGYTTRVTEGAMRAVSSDVVAVNDRTLGWGPSESSPSNPSTLMWVMEMGLRPDHQVDVILMMYVASLYDDVLHRDATQVPRSSLANPWYVTPPSSLTLQSGTSDPRIRAGWTDSPDASLLYYEVQAQRTTPADPNVAADEVFKDYGKALSDSPYLFIANVTTGDVWSVRVRAVNRIGATSDWVTVTGYTATISKIAQFSVARAVDATGVRYTITFGDKCDRVEAYTVENPTSAAVVPPQSSAYLSFVARAQNGAVQTFPIAASVAGSYRTTLLVGYTSDGVQGLIIGPLQDQESTSGAAPSAAPTGLTLGSVTQTTQPISWNNNGDTISTTLIVVDGIVVFETAANATTATLGNGTVCPAFSPGTTHSVDIRHARNGQLSAVAGAQNFTTSGLATAVAGFVGAAMTQQVVGSKKWDHVQMTWTDVGPYEIYESFNDATPGSGTRVASGASEPGGGIDYSRRDGTTGNYYYWIRGTSPVTAWAALGGTTPNPVTWVI